MWNAVESVWNIKNPAIDANDLEKKLAVYENVYAIETGINQGKAVIPDCLGALVGEGATIFSGGMAGIVGGNIAWEGVSRLVEPYVNQHIENNMQKLSVNCYNTVLEKVNGLISVYANDDNKQLAPSEKYKGLQTLEHEIRSLAIKYRHHPVIERGLQAGLNNIHFHMKSYTKSPVLLASSPVKSPKAVKKIQTDNQKFLNFFGMDSRRFSDAQNIKLNEHIKTYQQQQLLQQREINAGRKILADYQGVSDFFGAVGMLGGDFGKIGTVGQQIVSIHKNISLLAGNIPGIAIPQGLAALSPISAIFTAGLTIIGLFRRKKQGPNPFQALSQQIQALSQQMHELLLEMRQHFEQVYRNQQKILETLIDGIRYLENLIDRRIDDVIYPTMYTLDNVSTDINQMFQVLSGQNQAISLRDYENVIFTTKQILGRDSGLIEERVHEKLIEALWSLELWLTDRSCTDLYNGKLYLNSADNVQMAIRLINQTFSQALFKDYKEQYLHGLIGYLAEKARSLLGDVFSPEINMRQLINPVVWANGIDTYLSIREDFLWRKNSYDRENAKITAVKKVAENTLAFIHFVRNCPQLFEYLFDQYLLVAREFEAVIKQTIWRNSLEDIAKDLSKQLETVQLVVDDNALQKLTSPNFPAKIGPIYHALRERLENRRKENSANHHESFVWLSELLEDNNALNMLLEILQNPQLNSLAHSALVKQIIGDLKTPLMTLALPTKPVADGYVIPLCVKDLLTQLKIPPMLLLAERFGILQFDTTYEYHHNPNGFRAGSRQPNDQYRCTVKVNIKMGGKIIALYDFDCVGSLLDNDGTKHIPQLLDEIYAYWFPNYNVHYGDGRYKPNACGIATTPIMYATAIIGPFLGNTPKLQHKNNYNIISHDELQKLTSELRNKIVHKINLIRQSTFNRLSTPNTDWTALQQVLDKAQATYNFIRAYLQLIGIDPEIINNLSIFSRHNIDIYIKSQFEKLAKPQLESVEKAGQEKILVLDVDEREKNVPVIVEKMNEIKQDSIALHIVNQLQLLKSKVLTIIKAAKEKQQYYNYNSTIEKHIKIWLAKLDAFILANIVEAEVLASASQLLHEDSVAERNADNQALNTGAPVVLDQAKQNKGNKRLRADAQDKQVAETEANDQQQTEMSENTSIANSDTQRRKLPATAASKNSPIESEQTKLIRQFVKKIEKTVSSNLRITLNQQQSEELQHEIFNELCQLKYKNIMSQFNVDKNQDEFLQILIKFLVEKGLGESNKHLLSISIKQSIEEVYNKISKNESQPAATWGCGLM